MVSIVKFLELQEKGITMDDVFIVTLIGEGKKNLYCIVDLGPFIEKVIEKGLVKSGDIVTVDLTEEGTALFEEVMEKKIEKKTSVDQDYFISLNKKLKEKLKELTGSTHKSDRIRGGKSYPFLPGIGDLKEFLLRFYRKYGYHDSVKIEKCLMRYMERCSNENSWFPLLKYYIAHAEKGSQLASDLENFEEEDEVKEQKPSQRFL